jgi:hypothetical protein
MRIWYKNRWCPSGGWWVHQPLAILIGFQRKWESNRKSLIREQILHVVRKLVIVRLWNWRWGNFPCPRSDLGKVVPKFVKPPRRVCYLVLSYTWKLKSAIRAILHRCVGIDQTQDGAGNGLRDACTTTMQSHRLQKLWSPKNTVDFVRVRVFRVQIVANAKM